jgi:HlyD family secretion protein
VNVRARNGAILRQLRTLYNIGTIRELSDGQLLERFATDRDEVAELAFAALVERHEGLVWRVCLAVLRDEHDAEDAFQATFLVLVRKARSLWVQDSLGPWLHEVACRTASCLRSTVTRRRKHEQRRATNHSTATFEGGFAHDPGRDAVVHEVVNSLPEKYRAPIVLCDFEGRTHQEAARFLGWPIGTVKSRQSQGRRLIRDRLLRRGLGPAVAVAVVDSLRQTALAATPKELSRTTVTAAMLETAHGVIGLRASAHVLTLTQGVLRAMLWSKLRFVAMTVIAVGLASVGVTAFVCGSQEPPDTQHPPLANPPTTRRAQAARQNTSSAPNGQPEPGTPQARLLAQRLATRKAKATYELAKATRELAEIAVEQYEAVDYPRDLVIVEGEVKLAESDLTRSEDRADWARRMFTKGYITPAVRNSEQLTLKRAVFSLEQAQSKKKVLEKYTKDKTIKGLKVKVENAHDDERAKELDWDREKLEELELERQLGSNTN